MSIQNTLEMDFATELNKTYRMRVYEAREDLTSAEIAAVMDDIITKNIFTTNGGELTGKLAARIVSRETQEFDLT
ncbi:MAG: DUF2922 domain-containing protein [Syntrophomonadaceae bacterium]|nr:DUF2922 domain-containing protein [Syntrophomonadaceae bacterium]